MIKRDKNTGRFVSTKKSAQKKTVAKKPACKCTKKSSAKKTTCKCAKKTPAKKSAK